jgi:hypothetical protein
LRRDVQACFLADFTYLDGERAVGREDRERLGRGFEAGQQPGAATLPLVTGVGLLSGIGPAQVLAG